MTRKRKIQQQDPPKPKKGKLAISSQQTISNNEDLSNQRLPRELYLQIFRLLSMVSLMNARLTCKLWKRIADEIVTVLDFSVRPSDLGLKYSSEMIGDLILADQEWLSATRFKEVVIARSLPVVSLNVMNNSVITDALLKQFVEAHGKHLKHLILDGSAKITGSSIIAISNNCPVLETLDISCLYKIVNDRSFAYFTTGKLQNTLKSVFLRGCKFVSDTTIKYLVSCKNIEELDLFDCGSSLDSNSLKEIAQNFPKLKILNIRRNRQIKQIDELNNISSLTSLSISGYQLHFNPKTEWKLPELKNLTISIFSKCPKTTSIAFPKLQNVILENYCEIEPLREYFESFLSTAPVISSLRIQRAPILYEDEYEIYTPLLINQESYQLLSKCKYLKKLQLLCVSPFDEKLSIPSLETLKIEQTAVPPVVLSTLSSKLSITITILVNFPRLREFKLKGLSYVKKGNAPLEAYLNAGTVEVYSFLQFVQLDSLEIVSQCKKIRFEKSALPFLKETLSICKKVETIQIFCQGIENNLEIPSKYKVSVNTSTFSLTVPWTSFSLHASRSSRIVIPDSHVFQDFILAVPMYENFVRGKIRAKTLALTGVLKDWDIDEEYTELLGIYNTDVDNINWTKFTNLKYLYVFDKDIAFSGDLLRDLLKKVQNSPKFQKIIVDTVAVEFNKGTKHVDLSLEDRTKIEYVTQFKHQKKILGNLVREGVVTTFFRNYVHERAKTLVY